MNGVPTLKQLTKSSFSIQLPSGKFLGRYTLDTDLLEVPASHAYCYATEADAIDAYDGWVARGNNRCPVCDDNLDTEHTCMGTEVAR
jgi:hypothetical protein